MPRTRLLHWPIMAMAFCLPANAYAASWLCVGDLATGFTFDKSTRRWRIANFNTNDSKYVVTESPSKESPYIVRGFGAGNEFPVAFCKDGFQSETFLRCKGIGVDFAFNAKTLRYSYSYNVGYINPTPGLNDMKEGDDTPMLEIGQCSRLQ